MMNTSKLIKITVAKMPQNPDQDSEKRFEEAQKQLSSALDNLEKAAIEKLHETSLNSNMFNVGEDDESIKARVIEQTATIQNLNNELNELQKTISEVSTENESLLDQNKSLLNKINQLRLTSGNLVDDIEIDLMQISKIIKRGE